MRIACISDVHANIIALEAVFKHIKEQGVDVVYCLGDLVNQNVWNNEVVDFMRAEAIPCVLGNHDEGIGNNKKDFPFAYGSREAWEWGHEAINFTLEQVSAENKTYLKTLPGAICLSISAGEQMLRIHLTHGVPGNNEGRLYYFQPLLQFEETIEKTDADILLLGNTHWPVHKTITTGTAAAAYRHVINPGSAGCPKDGYWKASYALIDIKEQEVKQSKEAVKTIFYKVDYDLDKAIKAIQHSKLPLYYAARLLQ